MQNRTAKNLTYNFFQKFLEFQEPFFKKVLGGVKGQRPLYYFNLVTSTFGTASICSFVGSWVPSRAIFAAEARAAKESAVGISASEA
jgi:hypothetical protein